HLAQLQNDKFILFREGYHLRQLTLKACAAAGFRPQVVVSGTDVDTALRFVKAGLGVTLIPESAAGSVPGIHTPWLEDPPVYRRVGMAWNPRRYLSKAAQALLEFLREACKE